MGRSSRKSGIEQAVESLSILPWWVCLVLAVITWALFHRLSQLEPPLAKDVAQLGATVQVTMFTTAGMFLQYISPFVLLLAALGSWIAKRRRMKLLVEAETRTGSAPLRDLSWRDFEQMVGAHFERLGYSVSFTADGADGGIDVFARKGSELFLIQCKQWRATQVGVSVVRELFGVIAARGATGGFVVSIGPFTSDAKAFAEGRNIELVDANTLLRSSGNRPTSTAQSAAPPISPSSPACPKCGATMVRRLAKQGSNRGQAFFGCSTYPLCRGTLPAN